MRTRIVLLGAVGLLCAVLAGCGGGSKATEPILLTAESIRRRMPDPAEISADWTTEGEPAVVDLERRDGPFVGVCGGPGFIGLAMDQGVQHVVRSAYFWTPEGSRGSVLVMTFPTEAEATAMLATVPTECELSTPSVPESIVQTVQSAGQENDDDAGSWKVDEASTTFAPQASDADQRLGLVYTMAIDSDDACSVPDCGWESTHVRIVDRYGNLVVITLLYGRKKLRGFGNNDEATIPAATPEQAQAVAEKFLPALLDRLEGQPGS